MSQDQKLLADTRFSLQPSQYLNQILNQLGRLHHQIIVQFGRRSHLMVVMVELMTLEVEL